MSVVAVESFLRISECGIVAAVALLTFDYCLTFGQEIEWLYGTRWTAARIHFTTSRYLPFVAIAMGIPTSRVAPPREANYCDSLGVATNIMYYLCIVFAEAMLIVRTYAFCGRNRKILIGTCTFGVLCVVAAIVASETITSQSTDPVYRSLHCPGSNGSVATAIAFSCLILYEMGMLGLNLVAFRRMKQHSSLSPLITTLCRDGVVYVAAILEVFSLINAVVTLATPVQYSDILNSPQVVMHSILASRIFFNLRATSRREQDMSVDTPLTELEFRATPQDSNVFSSTLASSSSSRAPDPATIDTARIMDVIGEDVVEINRLKV